MLVEKLVSATPMFSMPAYVHPDIRDVWATVGDALVASAPERSYPRRIFCARRMTKRACRNADAVESLFEQHGFEVVYRDEVFLRVYRGEDGLLNIPRPPLDLLATVEGVRHGTGAAGRAGRDRGTGRHCATGDRG